MKRRIVSMMLVAAMGTALLAGCGGNTANSSTAEKSNDTAKEDTAPVTETAGTDAETGTSDEGKVLNIYCWNEEFKSRLTDLYPNQMLKYTVHHHSLLPAHSFLLIR